jgi:hypothetical protein
VKWNAHVDFLMFLFRYKNFNNVKRHIENGLSGRKLFWPQLFSLDESVSDFRLRVVIFWHYSTLECVRPSQHDAIFENCINSEKLIKM